MAKVERSVVIIASGAVRATVGLGGRVLDGVDRVENGGVYRGSPGIVRAVAGRKESGGSGARKLMCGRVS